MSRIITAVKEKKGEITIHMRLKAQCVLSIHITVRVRRIQSNIPCMSIYRKMQAPPQATNGRQDGFVKIIGPKMLQNALSRVSVSCKFVCPTLLSRALLSTMALRFRQLRVLPPRFHILALLVERERLGILPCGPNSRKTGGAM